MERGKLILIKGVSMKFKKKAKMMIVLSIVASLLSGCGFGEKQIDYKPFVKALDEGDMRKVMSAVMMGMRM